MTAILLNTFLPVSISSPSPPGCPGDLGEIEWQKPCNTGLIERQMKKLTRKYSLPHLLPVEIRHWVSSACRDSGLSKVATSYLQGHDSTQSGVMRDFYDNPPEEEVFEEQAKCIPQGPLGTLKRIEILGSIPEEVGIMWSAYLEGKIGTMEFAGQVEALRNRIVTEEASRSRLL
jgi:hypothetical protein